MAPGQLPPDVPVFWSGLPTPLEPKSLQVGAGVVNGTIARSGVHVLRWYAAAYLHPEYMLAAGRNVHYSPAGYAAWPRWSRLRLMPNRKSAVPSHR